MTDIDTSRITGVAYCPFDPDSGREFGKRRTRHAAVGAAAIFGRILDEELTVRVHDTKWREAEEPTVCDYCGHEEHLRPLVNWHFCSGEGIPTGAFCSTQCRARAEYDAEGVAIDG